MADAPTLRAVFGRPPEEAVAYLARKGVATTWDYAEMLGAAHQRAFTAAGILKLDALEAIRTSLVQALHDGLPYAAWLDRVTPDLERRGLLGRHRLVNPETGEVKTMAPWRLRTIYATNTQSAMMAGRYAQMAAAAGTHPWWQYTAVMDRRTRPQHAALNGQTFRHDDAFWQTHYPPLGYRCRCRVRPVSEASRRDEGIATSSGEGRMGRSTVIVGRGDAARQAEVAWFDAGGGRKVYTDPGFAHSPAAAPVALDLPQRQERLQMLLAENQRMDTPRLIAAIVGSAETIRKSAREHLIGYDVAGNRLFHAVGGVASVEIPREWMGRLEGAVLLHNHPLVSSFSDADIEIAMTQRLAEVRVVDPVFDYRMRPPVGGRWDAAQWGEVRPVFHRHRAAVEAQWGAALARGEITREAHDGMKMDEVWRRVADETGLRYYVRRRK